MSMKLSWAFVVLISVAFVEGNLVQRRSLADECTDAVKAICKANACPIDGTNVDTCCKCFKTCCPSKNGDKLITNSIEAKNTVLSISAPVPGPSAENTKESVLPTTVAKLDSVIVNASIASGGGGGYGPDKPTKVVVVKDGKCKGTDCPQEQIENNEPPEIVFPGKPRSNIKPANKTSAKAKSAKAKAGPISTTAKPSPTPAPKAKKARKRREAYEGSHGPIWGSAPAQDIPSSDDEPISIGIHKHKHEHRDCTRKEKRDINDHTLGGHTDNENERMKRKDKKQHHKRDRRGAGSVNADMGPDMDMGSSKQGNDDDAIDAETGFTCDPSNPKTAKACNPAGEARVKRALPKPTPVIPELTTMKNEFEVEDDDLLSKDPGKGPKLSHTESNDTIGSGNKTLANANNSTILSGKTDLPLPLSKPGLCRPLSQGLQCLKLGKDADPAMCKDDVGCEGTKKCCFYSCPPNEDVGICEYPIMS